LVKNKYNHFNQTNLKIVACSNEPAAAGVKFHRAKLRPAFDMKTEQVGVDESIKLGFLVFGQNRLTTEAGWIFHNRSLSLNLQARIWKLYLSKGFRLNLLALLQQPEST